jgi:hypothetical protein
MLSEAINEHPGKLITVTDNIAAALAFSSNSEKPALTKAWLPSALQQAPGVSVMHNAYCSRALFI